ncbi:MAG TPA: GIY-YIG nuclease family protein [Methanosarcina sp.]|nr:GIY-YIG nuclease family protein [Methanosarcina sp.]
MHYYLYQITNKVNNKIYVGVHKTSNLNDGYMGSGAVIKHAIEKYGIENFEKVILETFNNSKDMFEREKQVVTEEFLTRDDVYNLRRGGNGGFDYINANPEIKQKREDAIRSNLAVGEKNSVYGKIWITNGSSSTMIDPGEPIPDGWKLGRTISKKQKESVTNYRTGTIRITNGVQNKYIKKTDPMPDGWKLGWTNNPL